jgi:Domain of unknown function (DUF4203)
MVMGGPLLGLIILLIGLALCFAGYKLFRVILVIWGLLTGFQIGMLLATQIFGEQYAGSALQWIAGIIVAIVFALLAYVLYKWQIVLAGALVGYFLGTALASALSVTPDWVVIAIGLAGAIMLGALVLILDLPRLIIIVSTALVGAGASVAGLLVLLSQVNIDDLLTGIAGPIARVSLLWTLIWAALVIVGMIFQWTTTQERTMRAYPTVERG